jgi:RNA-binding protein
MFISNKEVAKLKSNAHRLKPLIQIGKKGVTDEQIETIEKLLEKHELIKIKFNEFKFQKRELSSIIAERTESMIVDIIGNTLILFKEKEPNK